VLKQVRKDHPATLSIESYLIMPVQRILRYKMLIEEIIKYTDPNSADAEDLQKALALVSDRASQCNEATRKEDNTQALRRIQKTLQGVEVVGDSRILLCEGPLHRVRSRKGDRVRCSFYLFNDTLIIAEAAAMSMGDWARERVTRKIDLGDPLRDSKGNPANRITVSAKAEGGRLIRVADRPDDDAGPFGLEVLTSKESFIVLAQDPDAKARWLDALDRAVQAAQQALCITVPAPILEREDRCQICRTTVTFASRNCRKCGQCVCLKCSVEAHRPPAVKEPLPASQVTSIKTRRTESAQVHNRDVCKWYEELCLQAGQLKEDLARVYVCHQCLYGCPPPPPTHTLLGVCPGAQGAAAPRSARRAAAGPRAKADTDAGGLADRRAARERDPCQSALSSTTCCWDLLPAAPPAAPRLPTQGSLVTAPWSQRAWAAVVPVPVPPSVSPAPRRPDGRRSIPPPPSLRVPLTRGVGAGGGTTARTR
jgi:hypothetical protein